VQAGVKILPRGLCPQLAFSVLRGPTFAIGEFLKRPDDEHPEQPHRQAREASDLDQTSMQWADAIGEVVKKEMIAT
jgi:hypothetical protein